MINNEAKINKEEILIKATKFFKDIIAPNHLKNLVKLKKLSNFTYNPFLLKYLSFFLSGNQNPESIAKALIYPRILGTSINTSFGNNLQKFCSVVLPGFGSAVNGIDLEFIDQIDGRKKYCQIKAGPQTINKDDVDTISRHFNGVKNLARTNHLDIRLEDLVIGILYGTKDELSANYKTLAIEYPVYIGKDFWHRLTGDKDFYLDLINSFGEIALETDAQELLNEVIKELSKDISKKILS